jgi:hypothetical protein
MQVSKDVWGGTFWRMMHILSINITDSQIMYNILKDYGELLPCHECSEHYKQTTIDRLDNYVIWCYTFHNKVNQWLMKKTFNTKALQKLYIPYANNESKIKHTLNKLLLILVLAYNKSEKHDSVLIYFINNLKYCFKNKEIDISITQDNLSDEAFVNWYVDTFNKLNNKNMNFEKIRKMYLPIYNKLII